MKAPSAAFTVMVILLCAFSTGGQQSKKRQGQAIDFVPAGAEVRRRMPDGRVVEFPRSTSKEEIDAAAKHIAEGGI